MGGQDFGARLTIYAPGMCDECDSSRCGCSETVPRLAGNEFEVEALEACPCATGLANFNPHGGNIIR